MSKHFKSLTAATKSGTQNRFGRSRLGGGITASNSNAKIVSPPNTRQAVLNTTDKNHNNNLGLNSERARSIMIQNLRTQGITNETVLSAMMAVPRHLFVDQGLASRAYENAALPIGYNQTISQPWVVARMISAILDNGVPDKVLEVGGGCGYQAAVIAQIVKNVYVIERIRGLYEQSLEHIGQLKLSSHIYLSHGDGMLGLPSKAPFDAIIVAAAGIEIPRALLQQLTIGGRLIAPEGESIQHLILIERTGASTWKRQKLEEVRFVPLRSGVQS